jgi:hypothetical protein
MPNISFSVWQRRRSASQTAGAAASHRKRVRKDRASLECLSNVKKVAICSKFVCLTVSFSFFEAVARIMVRCKQQNVMTQLFRNRRYVYDQLFGTTDTEVEVQNGDAHINTLNTLPVLLRHQPTSGCSKAQHTQNSVFDIILCQILLVYGTRAHFVSNHRSMVELGSFVSVAL